MCAEPERPGVRPWFEQAFESRYLRVYPHRTAQAARAEVQGLLARGLLARGGRVLDLACGQGRHVVALRAAGADAFGLDLSAELLAHARQAGGAHLLHGRLARGDVRRLPFVAAAFDALVMLFSSFGYFDDDENQRVLAGIARVLRAGGVAVLDLMNPALVRAALVPESVSEREGLRVREVRRLAQDGRRVVKDVELREAGGGVHRWREDVRLYEAEELRVLGARHGLCVERVEGDFDGRALEADAPRQILWLRKPLAAGRDPQ
jgi:SAM-dependent methyltransferase